MVKRPGTGSRVGFILFCYFYLIFRFVVCATLFVIVVTKLPLSIVHFAWTLLLYVDTCFPVSNRHEVTWYVFRCVVRQIPSIYSHLHVQFVSKNGWLTSETYQDTCSHVAIPDGFDNTESTPNCLMHRYTPSSNRCHVIIV